MATVAELSGPYANFMLNPLPPGAPDVCGICMTFTEGRGTCYPCGWEARFADVVLPISYSVHFGQLHTALAQYKRTPGAVGRRLQMELAAVLWRFLRQHEAASPGPPAQRASISSRLSRPATASAMTRIRCGASWEPTWAQRATDIRRCSLARERPSHHGRWIQASSARHGISLVSRFC
jgi:hypothetical protein